MISDKFDKLAVREKIGLLAAAVLVLCVVTERLVVESVWRRCGQLDRDIVKAVKEVRYNQGVLLKQKQVAAEYDDVKGMLGVTVTADEAIESMKGELDDMARRTGVKLQSMEHREPLKTDFACDEYTVVIGSFEADIKQLLTFLYEVQKAPGMLRVNKLSVSPGKNKDAVKGSMQVVKLLMPAES